MRLLPARICAAFLLLAVTISSYSRGAEPAVILTVQTDRPGARISPTMWGVFFEDVNFAADGGLYAELVKNRSFEFPNPMMGWSGIPSDAAPSSIEILDQDPFNTANPHYLRLKADAAGKVLGVSNEGFRGMGVRQGEVYKFSAQVRAVEGRPALRVELLSGDGRKLAQAKVAGLTKKWKKYTANLRAAATEPKAKLNVYVQGPGVVDLDMVSLFPEKTWKDRPSGLRADLVQMLADLKPAFIKFPGGFLTEGRRLDNRYQWKATIGDIAERKLIISPWNAPGPRAAPDYFQSYGLGFFEYFQLCDDLGAEPQPLLNCGMAAQFSGEFAPLDKLEPYIQDALDLIEFANGPATSTWGKKRADMGHPQPFNLKMIRWGNEQVGPQYIERYERFAKALKAKHPEIKLVGGAGPDPAGDNFKFAWDKLRQLKADFVDEHCHAQPSWFFNSAARYDKYDRNGPKVMMGEFAAHSEPGLVSLNNRSNLNCALSEAAFFTGLERNADVVLMSCYACLLAHTDAWQWIPDLIWFDNLNVYGTPSYYVQQMFSRNRGDVVLPLDIQAAEVGGDQKGGAIGVGTWATQAEFKDLKITRDGRTLFSTDFADGTDGWKLLGEGDWNADDGVLSQHSAAENVRAILSDKFFTDCTYSLKARKLGGTEGFLILFNVEDENAKSWWNLGGFANTRHAIEMFGTNALVPGSIETGRWYDIKIERKGEKVNCYLDGKLVQSTEAPAPRRWRIYATAARDDNSGEIILKVVNPAGEPADTLVRLKGVAKVAGKADVTILAGTSLADENSIAEPKKIAPATSSIL
ncbi:MAG: alpha-L-arabinofuranosidase C-terminal domain-containing protein, partial [Thermoguttaceae bacterium]